MNVTDNVVIINVLALARGESPFERGGEVREDKVSSVGVT